MAPAQIAKTLSLRVGDRALLVVTSGVARLDNKKARAVFGGKPRMLGADEVVAVTGHPVGGVCPFGLATPIPVYCDQSLLAFDEVMPAAGSIHAALRIEPRPGWRRWWPQNGSMSVDSPTDPAQPSPPLGVEALMVRIIALLSLLATTGCMVYPYGGAYAGYGAYGYG